VSADAARMRLARQAARRREAVRALRLGEATCAYTAQELGNGLDPGAARRAAMEAAAELAEVAEVLRRSVRPTRFEREWMARQWMDLGFLSARQVADRLGVSERTVWRYLGHP
jgi:hypothetical protein